MSSTGNTVRLHRVLRAPAERVYRAFLEPDAMAKWLQQMCRRVCASVLRTPARGSQHGYPAEKIGAVLGSEARIIGRIEVANAAAVVG